MFSWLAVALSAGAAVYLLLPSDKQALQSVSAPAPVLASADKAGPSFALPTEAQYPPLAPVRARVFEMDFSGQLIIDANTAIRIDMLLAQLPEHATRHEMRAIEERAKEGLPEDVAGQALRILNLYIAYRKAEAELEAQQRHAGGVGAEAMLEHIIALRRAHFGQQLAEALFEAQEARARFDIQVARIEADPALGMRDKRQRIDTLRQALPPEVADEDEPPAAAFAVEEQVAMLRQRGASEADIWQLRRQMLGDEEALHLTEMEAQTSDWERRYQEFLRQKQAILSAALSEQQQREGIDALLRQHYSMQEIETARAYDRSRSIK